MKVLLTVIAGPHKGQQFEFEEHDNLFVGRSKKARFRMANDDPYFSRLHFVIEVNPPLCRLQDLESSNGTFVNGQRVASADLKNGDLIQGSDTTLRVMIQDAGAASDGVDATTLWERPVHLDPRPLAAQSTLTELPRANWPKAPLTASDGESKDAATSQPGTYQRDTSAISIAADALRLLPANYEELIRQQAQPIAGYRIVDELGRGSMGVVYRAIRLADGSVVALKIVLPAARGEQQDFGRLIREVDELRQLDQPRIVRLRDVGESEGLLYFVSDYVPGPDTDQLLLRRHREDCRHPGSSGWSAGLTTTPPPAPRGPPPSRLVRVERRLDNYSSASTARTAATPARPGGAPA